MDLASLVYWGIWPRPLSKSKSTHIQCRALKVLLANSRVDAKGVKPFLVEWYKSDTTFSILNLDKNVADVAITYHGVAEKTALDENIADRVVYAWRDHWMLIGMVIRLPPSRNIC